MPIVVTPEIGIPLPTDTTPEEIDDFRAKAHAFFNTVTDLVNGGLAIEVTDEDRDTARTAFASSEVPSVKTITPGAVVHLEAILTEWDHEILDVSRRLQNYVTNKLILESNDPDAKVRLRALELLGKVSSVGLFSERMDVTVTHRTLTDIESELKKTLELYTGNVIDITPEALPEKLPPSTSAALKNLDLDAELGSMRES